MSQKNTLSLIGMAIWIVCAMFFMYEFLLRTILGTFEYPIMSDLKLNFVAFAILSSTSYQLIYGMMQIPVGLITDKFGLKKTLFFASLICALSVFGFAFTHTFSTAVIFRIMTGFGSSFGFICLLAAVYDWMPRKNIALFIGLSQFIGTIGPMFAAGPMSSIANDSSIDWRYIFYALAFIGMLIAGLVLLIVKNNTDYTGSFQILKRPKPVATNIYRLIRQPQVWYIALFSAGVYFAIEYLSENSGKAFLVLNGYKADTASYMLTIAWLGYAVGCPLLGYISDMTHRRKAMMVVSAVFCLVSAVVIFYFPLNIVLLTSAFLMLGIGASGQSIGFAIMAEQCNHNYRAAGLGLNNAVIMLITSLNAPIIGGLLSVFSKKAAPSVSSYQHAFLLIIALMAMALVLSLFFIKETFCKSTKESAKLSVDSI